MASGIRFVILVHRYLGIGISLFFAIWFASGFVILYTGGMPSLTPAERLSHQQSLQLEQVRLSPSEARLVASSDSVPVLRVIADRPAYEFPGRNARIVFADDGSLYRSQEADFRLIVSRFANVDEGDILWEERIEEEDQWTVGQGIALPLLKYRLQDSSRTEVYVSPSKGQVVLSTTAVDRMLAWVGAIPHWLYFVDLRKNPQRWNNVVVILASLGTLLAIIGLVLAFTQLRKVRPFTIAAAIPYGGLMRWHYIFGFLFGLITLTWIFSGLLSMQPYNWSSAQSLQLPRNTLQQGDVDLGEFSQLTNQINDIRSAVGTIQNGGNGNFKEIKEITFNRALGKHFYQLTVSSEDSAWGYETVLLEQADASQKVELFDSDDIVTALESFDNRYELEEVTVLNEYDNYYYDRASSQGPQAPLPVVRLKYTDPAQTWYYADLNAGALQFQTHRLGRLERWLYHGLHSLDFRFWYDKRPLWDLGVLLLLLGGTLMSIFGLVLGYRRVKNSLLGSVSQYRKIP